MKFKKMLSGYDIIVVAFYRFWISRIYSSFMQFYIPLTSRNHEYIYFADYLSYYGNIPRMSTKHILGKLHDAFSNGELQIIDFYGAISHGLDPNQAFFCVAFGICSGVTSFHANPVDDKVVQQHQLFDTLNSVVRAHNCSWMGDPKHHENFILTMWEKVTNTTVPTTQKQLPMWFEYSKYGGLLIDNEYPNIFYRNREANNDVGQKFHIEEIDREELIGRREQGLLALFVSYRKSGALRCDWSV
mmetsp:Transcript_8908/g.13377  ORF Transcript_8908/g.13377 Transcript_8908/m.13377 type:complete len:244 (+) Transcript_8908:409-1140(+)